MKFYDLWSALENTSSTNEKLNILKSVKDDETAKKIFYYTYNGYYNYGIRELPADAWNVTNEKSTLPGNKFEELMFIVLDKLRNRELTGNAAQEALINLCYKSTTENAEILNAILNRDLDCGVSYKTINKVWDKLIPTFEIAKAEPYNPSKDIQLPMFAETKMNGVRMIATVSNQSITFYSSNGNVINGLDFLANQILELVSDLKTPHLILDGEFTGTNRKSISGYVNKLLKDTYTEKDIQYLKENSLFTVFDILPLKVWINKSVSRPLNERKAQIRKLFKGKELKNIEQISTWIINTKEEINKLFDELYQKGEEGIILKVMDAPYTFKRSDNFLKLKGENEADLHIAGFTTGGGKRANTVGAIICESSCGKVKVNVGSGLSDEDLEYIVKNQKALIGSVVTIRFNEIIKDKNSDTYSLFLPRFIEFRRDKLVGDDLEKITAETNGGEL